MSYKPFTVKLDAFPQIFGFMELRSHIIMNVELKNKAIKMMDNCFVRAKTTIDVVTPEDWIFITTGMLKSNSDKYALQVSHLIFLPS